MKIVRSLFEGLKKARPLRPVKPVIETLEGILLGSPETTAGAPHFLEHIEIKRYMSTVIAAMIPTTVAAVVFFGKEVFGGTGRNIFNPALVGRIFITIAFPEIMSATWQAPFSDVITAATPLAVYRSTQGAAPYLDLLLGQVAGSTGEVFRIGIIAGALLTNRSAYLQANFASLLFGLLMAGEFLNVLPYHPLSTAGAAPEPGSVIATLGRFLSFSSTLYIAVYLTTTIVSKLRQRERDRPRQPAPYLR